MKRRLQQTLAKIRDWKLRWKILSIVLAVLFCSIAVFAALYSFTWRAYENQLYSKAASSLSMTSQKLEAEMSYLQQALSSAATSKALQGTIRAMENSENVYQQYSRRRQVLSLINSAVSKFHYVLSIHYVDPGRNVTSVGLGTSIHSETQYGELYDIAVSRLGMPTWVVSEEALMLVCAIRETEALSLRDMGVILVRVQASQLVNDTVSVDTRTDDMLILSGETPVHHVGTIRDWRALKSAVDGRRYAVTMLDGAQRFITHATSEYCDFSYYYAVSYDALFAELETVRTVAVLVCVVFVAVLTIISLSLANSITRPMYALVQKMSRPAEAAFRKDSQDDEKLLARKDEVGIVARAYQDMLNTLEHLIEENYIKQLTIKDTQYRSLQAQLNPHFIYNTLDSIYWIAENAGEKQIAVMILSLGKLMRESIKETDAYSHLIPLSEELRNLGYYINIQKIRFGEQLDLRLDMAEDTLALKVPRMILQPLVENAIHYGVEMVEGPCEIRVSSRRRGAYFVIQVEDNGIGVEDDLLDKVQSEEFVPKGTGVGLKNILQRLQVLYGPEARLSISSRLPCGTRVLLRLPCRD